MIADVLIEAALHADDGSGRWVDDSGTYQRAYKLFRKKEGNLHPLFIAKSKPVTVGEWHDAVFSPTKGYAPRPGWHAGVLPLAPHLRTKQNRIAPHRVWAEVDMPAHHDWQSVADKSPTKDIRGRVPKGGTYRFKTNKMQGGAWMIGGAMRVNRELADHEVYGILRKAGVSHREANRELHHSMRRPTK